MQCVQNNIVIFSALCDSVVIRIAADLIQHKIVKMSVADTAGGKMDGKAP